MSEREAITGGEAPTPIATAQVSRPLLTRRNLHDLGDLPVEAIDEFELNFHEAVRRWSALTTCRLGGP